MDRKSMKAPVEKPGAVILPSRSRKGVWTALALLVVVLAAAIIFFSGGKEDKKRSRGVAVSVATVQMRDMPIEARSIGTVTAINSVAVKPHVSGQILQTFFREGQPVSTGQLLFTIDPRPLQAAVSQAEADVQSKQALVAQAEAAISKEQAALNQAKANKDRAAAIANNSAAQEKRYAILSKEGAVSMLEYDQRRTDAVSARASVAGEDAMVLNTQAAIKAARANLLSAKAQLSSARAVLQNARVQLGYTSIRSPIDGIAGAVQILTGNLVRQDTDTLVTINQISPIYVSLTIPEQQFAQVRNYAAAGAVTAEAFRSDGTALAQNGHLVFTNNAVDSATGTVLVKVLFDNSGHTLWPGQFANIVMKLALIPHAVVVPAHAVQAGQNGSFVWVVGRDKKVTMQPVTVGQTINDQTVISTGLRPGDVVVTDGQMQLTPGATVNVTKL
jgi:multidrug efflux system membrane fusion protein